MQNRTVRARALFEAVDVHVGLRVRNLRKLRCMSQTRLGDAIGISFQQVQKCEKGANRIGASRLFEFSEIFDIPISYFFDDMAPDIAGKPASELTTSDPYHIPEVVEMVHAYRRISDPETRQAFKEMAKAFANPAREMAQR
jgi:transcriptional regulator with XRE-family HTH domain